MCVCPNAVNYPYLVARTTYLLLKLSHVLRKYIRQTYVGDIHYVSNMFELLLKNHLFGGLITHIGV